jgi:RND family efflux transporter MFP subunit
MRHRAGPPQRCYPPRAWGLLVMLLPLLVACGEKSTYQQPPPPQVTVAQPARGSIEDYQEFTGNTQAIDTVQLRARVEGYLEKVLFKDGDRVKKGQLLFLIQQDTYRAKLQQAQGEVLNQKTKLQYAQTEFVRYSELLQEKGASQTDVDNWRYQRDSARAALMTAEASRDLAQLNLDYTRVTAPFDGRIDRHLVDPGNLVGSTEKTLLAEINRIDRIYVYFTISEKDLLYLMHATRLSPEAASKAKWPVYLGLAHEKGWPHPGYLDFAAISVTPTTGTLLVRGIFPNQDGMILPGLFARVRVPVARQRSVLLLPQAIGFDQQGLYVLVVNEKNTVERRAVTPGTEVDGWRVVESGLAGPEWVVVKGVLKAIPGRKVTPEQEKLTPPAGSQGAPEGKGAAPPAAGKGKAGS